MTIKRQWVAMMIIIAVMAIVVNSLLYSALIDKYFLSYIGENYNNQIEEIQEYSSFLILNESYTSGQMKMELRKYLDDPIVGITIYDISGNIVASVRENKKMHNSMMRRREVVEQNDDYDLVNENKDVGRVIITRQGTVESSLTSIKFKNALLVNSLLSGVIVLFFAIIVSLFISKKTTRDLIFTANYAKSMDVNEENKLKFSNIKEIKDIQNSLKILSTKLKLKQKSRKQKVDTIIHQARTPLTIIKSHLEGAIDGVVLMDETRLENCKHQVDNLTHIITNLNEVIETDQNQEQIDVETYNLVEELKKIVKGLNVQFEKKGIELIFICKEVIKITTDKYKLNQSIYNILTNAYKFTEVGGRVEVKVNYLNKNKVKISICDNGVGIAEEELDKVFDAYYRSNISQSIAGEGLGLFVARNNIEAIKGTIDVKSSIDKGSCFRIVIPNNIG
ncbi:MAG: sensor histidine kinase [Eubacteriaceae bacterium]